MGWVQHESVHGTGNRQCKCGHVFDSPDAPNYNFEPRGDTLVRVPDRVECPKCDSTDTYVRVFCHSCGKWVVCDRFTHGRCPYCYKILFELVQLTKGMILDYVKPLCDKHKEIVKKREAGRMRGEL